MQKKFSSPFRSVTCDAHVQMPYVILKKMVIRSLPSCCFRKCLFFSLSQWPNFLYIFAFGMATERPRMQKWQEGEAWLANRSIASFFVFVLTDLAFLSFLHGRPSANPPKGKNTKEIRSQNKRAKRKVLKTTRQQDILHKNKQNFIWFCDTRIARDRPDTLVQIPYAFRPIYFRNALGGSKSDLFDPWKCAIPGR